MLAINLFALHQAGGTVMPGGNDKHWDHQDLKDISSDHKHAKNLVLDLVSGSLCALLLPVYTIRDSEALLEYFALPASMLF